MTHAYIQGMRNSCSLGIPLQTFALWVALSASVVMAQAQSDCACCTEMHKQFDFWVGDWVVYDTNGTIVGENTIKKLEKGCILNEHWRGAKGSTGRSYNYFNLTDSTWNQLWVDSQGQHLELKGHGGDNQMTLDSELIPGKKVKYYFNRITWTSYPDGSITQIWEILDEKETLLTTVFHGIYRPKKKE